MSLCLRNHFLFCHNQSTISGLKLMFWVVPCHSVAALDTLQKIGIEVHLMHKFMPLDLFLVFCSKHAQSTTLGLKLMFWMVLRHFIVAPDPLQKIVSGCI